MTAKTSKRSANRSQTPGEISRPASNEPRRANKPLMEKRRRARINQSLAMLKALILDSAKSDNTKHSKLEKADILELTVRHFQRHRNLDTPGINKYRAGYADCVREVQRYLDTPDAQTMTVIDAGIRQRLVRHLENCVTEIDTDISPTITPNTQQETIYKEVNNVEKRLQPITNIPKCEPATIPTLPTEVLYNRMEVEPTEQDKKSRLEPDSSTAEEINNNAETNFRNENELSRIEEQNIPHQLPNSVIKMYDGNFVFVLPSHYIQLAAALGINLNQQQNGAIPVTEVINTVQEPIRNAQIVQNNVVQQLDKPINFSKNNEVNDMWRPW